MNRRRIVRLILSAAVLYTALPAAAGATGEPTVQSDALTEMLGTLGLDADQAEMFEYGLLPVGEDWWAFGAGGNSEVPATISDEEAPWSIPEAIGLNYIMWQDPATLPDFTAPISETEGMVSGGVEGGPMLGVPYAVMTAVMADDIPLGESPISSFKGGVMLQQQWDFVLDIPWLNRWEALPQFPDDTWNKGSFVLSLEYGRSPWDLTYYTFDGNGGIDSVSLPGFAYARNNVVMLGVQADPSYFGEGTDMYRIGGRLALDIRNTGDRVLTAPAGPLSESSFFGYPGIHTIVPGLPGQVDPVNVWPIVDDTGQLWFDVQTRSPWGGMHPTQWFSSFVQAGCDGSYVGHQYHNGVAEIFGSGPEGGLSGLLKGYILGDLEGKESLLFSSPCPWDGESPFSVVIDGGLLPTEDGQFQFVSRPFDFTASDVVRGDPMTHQGRQVIYDMLTGEKFEITPEPEPTPVAIEETPPATITHERTIETCWWCWGIVLLFVAVLLCILRLWLKTYEWWTCWLPWFLVIFIWVPFLLAGLWFFRPSWWWVPLLAWFPLVGGYTWYWAQKRSWWKPWHLYVVGGYLAALAAGMVVVGSPEWGLLLPLFWLPWVGFYFWFRGARQPWFKPWMWGLGAAYVAWNFIWVAALTPWWAWWFPAFAVPFLGWWFIDHGYDWQVLRGPKWCWVLPFAFLPFLAWWIPIWGPWWCFVIALFLAKTLVCAIFNHLKEEEWWTCWLPWFLVLFVWVPFLIAGLWFFRPNWWAWAMLPWFAIVPAYAYWWARRRSWWQDWMWYAVGGYLAVAAGAMYVVGAPEWGLLLGVFWAPWVGLYVWYRGMRQPWWKPWMFGLIGGFAVWQVYWFESLTPYWGWWLPIFLFPFLWWWFTDHGYEWDLVARKSCFLIPFALLPWLGYMVAIYCIPEYYLPLN